MHTYAYHKALIALATLAGLSVPLAPALAETVMQQCGQQYQAAKAGNTLNGMTWTQFRTDCAARLKASPAAATAPVPAANPLKPTPAAAPATPVEETPPEPTAASPTAPASAASAKPLSPGRAAERVRIKACGAEWKANKVTLVAATPGLKWPQYWHTCSARMKAAGQ